jgi:8-oxo-dGTP diphosphatase
VLRQASPPLIAVVRLRKRNEWVLPKGKLDDGETPRDAAEREVNEETGHDVTVCEFLGTLVYESGGRSKVVHYWRMEANGGQAYDLTSDVREVDWLPLDAALERLSRGYERAFLANVGPLALQAAASNGVRAKAKTPASKKRRSRPPVPAQPPLVPPPVKVSPAPEPAVVANEIAGSEPAVDAMEAVPPVEAPEPVAPVDPSELTAAAEEPAPALPADRLGSKTVKLQPDTVPQAGTPELPDRATSTVEGRRKTFAERLRDLLRRAV